MFSQMYSPGLFTWIQYMNKSNSNRSSQKKKMPKTQQSSPSNGNGKMPRSQGEFAPEFAPVAVSQRQGTQKPRMASSVSRNGDLRVRVRHREYIADILGSVAYAVTSYSINPGLAATFPWLAQLANLFESYRFNKLVFQFRTQAATSATGKALLSVDWDAADAVPTSKVQQLQERTKMDDAAWKNFDLPCDLQDLLKLPQRFTRATGLSANLDIKTYDVGNLLVGTQGQANANAIGELWVEYDIELITPQSSDVAGAGVGVKIVANGAISDVNLFGNTPTVTGSTSLVTVSGNIIVFNKAGQYLVDILRVGTGLAALTLSGTAVTKTALSTTIDAAGTGALSQIRVVSQSPGVTLIVDASADTTDTASTTRVISAETAAVI